MGRINVLVHGALGKMGQEVLRALCRDPELEAVAGVDLKASDEELLLPDGSRSIPLSTDLESTLERYHPDVLVDFTAAKATMAAVRTAVKHNVRLVIGTTGLSTADLDEIKSLCQSQGVGAIVAPNFSLAAVVMIHLAKMAARFFDSDSTYSNMLVLREAIDRYGIFPILYSDNDSKFKIIRYEGSRFFSLTARKP